MLYYRGTVFRVDSRLRECDNYAFFAILAQNFKFPAWLFPHCAEIWRISGNLVRFSGHSDYISVPLIYSVSLIPLFSTDLVLWRHWISIG